MPKGKRRQMSYHCHKVRVGDAGHKGRGVFAKEPIKQGEAAESAPALTIPARDVGRLSESFLTNYTFSHRDDYELIALGYVSLYNHSFDPNAHFVLMQDSILIIALRPIAAGEEISFDYGWSAAAFQSVGIEVPADFSFSDGVLPRRG